MRRKIDALGLSVKIDKRKMAVGSVLAFVILLVCCIWFSKKIGLLFAALFLCMGCIKIETRNVYVNYLLNILWCIACVFMVIKMCITSPMISSVYLQDDTQTGKMLIFNIMCVLLLTEIIFLLTANWKLAISVSTCILMLLTTANEFIYQFRGKELGPMDLLSVGTALSVADQYNFHFSATQAYCWFAWLAVIFFQFSIPQLPGKHLHRLRWTAVPVSVLIILALNWGTADIMIRSWDRDGSIINGYYLNFYMGICNSFISKPDNYSEKNLENYSQQYGLDTEETAQQDYPNIIVIMNESYVDLSIFNEQPKTNIPVTPFIDSLSDNVVRGHALCSVYGGNTPNTEFEFLTGHTLAFLPDNVVPYQQYISDEIYSLVWLLKSYGYTTASTHPFYANGWSRNSVYPLLGFEECAFLESYACQNMVRTFVSDQELVEHVLSRLDQKTENEPLFLFGITMQNHGGYTYSGDNLVQTVQLEGYDQEYPLAEQYLSLINLTDQAMEYLLTALESYTEDTVVVFFGDHYPKIETEFYEELNGGAFETLDQQMLQYTVPFFIWTNYDIPEDTVELTSISYLARYVLECANIELPTYYQMLEDIEEVIPAINAFGYYSLTEGRFLTCDEAAGEEKETLNKYEMLQYNNLFDAGNRNADIFGKYIDAGK